MNEKDGRGRRNEGSQKPCSSIQYVKLGNMDATSAKSLAVSGRQLVLR
jgi:hypothetical protein